MEIVLLERIEKLGQMGDVVNVKNGFARNFLLPQGKALRATEGNLKRFESQRADLEAHNLERRTEAEAVADQMSGAGIVLVRQAGETGQLYGSVSARDIAEGLDEVGYKLERRQIVLDRPIKELGIHGVRVSLHPEVSLDVTVNVARSETEAQQQALTGRAAVGDIDDALDDEFDDRDHETGSLEDDPAQENEGAETADASEAASDDEDAARADDEDAASTNEEENQQSE
jgi:large subunit ribosomal protein L9